MRAPLYVAVCAAVLMLTGCADSTAPTSRDARPSTATPAPTPSARDAAADLSDFTCTASTDGADRWSATGTLSNRGAASARYRVVVVVLDGPAGTATGNERTVKLSAGDSAVVDMGRVRGPAEGTCQVQVLRMPKAAPTSPPR